MSSQSSDLESTHSHRSSGALTRYLTTALMPYRTRPAAAGRHVSSGGRKRTSLAALPVVNVGDGALGKPALLDKLEIH